MKNLFNFFEKIKDDEADYIDDIEEFIDDSESIIKFPEYNLRTNESNSFVLGNSNDTNKRNYLIKNCNFSLLKTKDSSFRTESNIEKNVNFTIFKKGKN